MKEEDNDNRQQEGTQDIVDERLQDVAKTLQENENVSIWSESILFFVYKYSKYTINTTTCFSGLEY